MALPLSYTRVGRRTKSHDECRISAELSCSSLAQSASNSSVNIKSEAEEQVAQARVVPEPQAVHAGEAVPAVDGVEVREDVGERSEVVRAVSQDAAELVQVVAERLGIVGDHAIVGDGRDETAGPIEIALVLRLEGLEGLGAERNAVDVVAAARDAVQRPSGCVPIS